MLNVEKVVKAPKKPTPNNKRSGAPSLYVERKESIKPKPNEPSKLTKTIAIGKGGVGKFLIINSPIRYRNMAPKKPPIAT